MKKLFLGLLLMVFVVPANAGNEVQPQQWRDFEAAWMDAFSRDSVKALDKGESKLLILSEGTTAVFFLGDGQVKSLRISYAGGTPARYMKGIQQSIKTILGKSPETDSLVKEFQTAKPASLHKNVRGVCFERTLIEQLGWEFYATYGVQCPNKTK